MGATEKPGRYANLAAQSLLRHGHAIELVGLKAGAVEGHQIQTGQPAISDVDTITMYVGPQNQPPLYEYIKSLKPRRVIFNPGAENPVLPGGATELKVSSLLKPAPWLCYQWERID